MSSEGYLPEVLSAGQAKDAVLHTRNKIILADFAAPSFGDRLIRRLWSRLTASRAAALSRGRPAVVVSEQLIENALLLREVDPGMRRVLDFGGFESTLPLALASLGVDVTVVDQRRYPFRHERLHVVQHDILRPLDSLPNDFDLVYSISTIEHIGLGGYGEPRAANGDETAVAHLWQKVRPGGRLFISVPAGEASEQSSYRVYSPATLARLLPAPGQVRYFQKLGRHGVWRECSAEEIASHRYENHHADFPVEGVAIAIITKPRA